MIISSIKSWFKNRIALIISVIALLCAVYFDHSYGYYQILRLLVCGTCAYFSYKTAEQDRKVWAWILGIIAFLFNPIIPIRFDRETWQWFDFITSIILLVFVFIPKGLNKKGDRT